MLSEINDKKIWEEFVSRQPFSPFMQSWGWGEFQKLLGHKVLRLGYLESGTLSACAQVVVGSRKAAHYAYVPHGPVLDWSDNKMVSRFVTDLKEVIASEGVDYLRFDPRVEDSPSISKRLTDAKFRPAVLPAQFAVSWVLDLEPSGEELLAAMRSNTRYRIRQSERVGLVVDQELNEETEKEFFSLVAEAARRQGFVAQGKDYLKKQIETLSSYGMVRIFVSKLEGKPLATAEVLSYGDTANYAHGGAELSSKVSAAHLLHWRAILQAKNEGRKIYDFGGITRSESEKHPWYGITWFKKGFGGRAVHLAGTWDLPLSSRYHLFRMLEKYYKMRGHGG